MPDIGGLAKNGSENELQRAASHRAVDYHSSFLDLTDDTESRPVSPSNRLEPDTCDYPFLTYTGNAEPPCQSSLIHVTIEKCIARAAPVSEGSHNAQRPISFHVPRHALEHVGKWALCSRIPEHQEYQKYRILWIDGGGSHPNHIHESLPTASELSRAHMVCIFFKCTPDLGHKDVKTSQENMSGQEVITVALLYGIIVQLTSLLPENIKEDSELHCIQLAALDGSLGSAPVALSAIRVLLDHAVANPIAFIIDGLPFAEGPSTNSFLRELVEMLRHRDNDPCTLLLFSTEGESEVLSETIKLHERLRV
ncbi:hypothetical protein TSTA_087890 [Talaromyces stipitatus ATCC 10500]|uniref:Uncharacterized protein n=1 Tax=Talaromyces stipitatus (strain ATCC 10500 / CBS 375.48 / QM 6759 / NRRL 1006) TaxID=441959 RepID=B8M289_TALSN|nr:uncharacterized protein TSTA_087890 [Talaromyces stipitatus ATCC 10500]EED21553.1 hypothetical protein TSTA_087890 [Talaromyces stipitatus ATCC 10500]